MNPDVLGVALLCFLIGSIPCGLLITKLAKTQDLRTIGSGNIGATNVFRTGNKWLALLTLLCDALKGAFSYWISTTLLARYAPGAEFNNPAFFAAIFSVCGHIFTPWLKFKGGKGVATYLGLLACVSLWLVLVFAVVWISLILIFSYSSISSMVTLFITGVGIFWLFTEFNPYSPFAHGIASLETSILILWILVYTAHRENIKRLLTGTEHKISWNRK